MEEIQSLKRREESIVSCSAGKTIVTYWWNLFCNFRSVSVLNMCAASILQSSNFCIRYVKLKRSTENQTRWLTCPSIIFTILTYVYMYVKVEKSTDCMYVYFCCLCPFQICHQIDMGRMLLRPETGRLNLPTRPTLFNEWKIALTAQILLNLHKPSSIPLFHFTRNCLLLIEQTQTVNNWQILF